MRSALGHRTDTYSLLREGETCWRASTATRATLLVDGEAYFSALRKALLRAREQILIAGRDFDSRILLPPDDDVLAFCGGIDLKHHRWDTSQHVPGDHRRVDSSGSPYMPVHDTQLCIAGPIAPALGEYPLSIERLLERRSG